MRWGVWEWTEFNTGGGEEIKRYEDGGPSTLCHLQASREARRRWKPGRWSLEGLEECWGLGENFYSLFLLSHKKSVFNHLWARDWRVLPKYQFLAELNGRRCLGESESFVFFVFSCCILLSVLDTVLGRKYSRINVEKNISKPLDAVKNCWIHYQTCWITLFKWFSIHHNME